VVQLPEAQAPRGLRVRICRWITVACVGVGCYRFITVKNSVTQGCWL
jgi:hypothetical protein